MRLQLQQTDLLVFLQSHPEEKSPVNQLNYEIEWPIFSTSSLLSLHLPPSISMHLHASLFPALILPRKRGMEGDKGEVSNSAAWAHLRRGSAWRPGAAVCLDRSNYPSCCFTVWNDWLAPSWTRCHTKHVAIIWKNILKVDWLSIICLLL